MKTTRLFFLALLAMGYLCSFGQNRFEILPMVINLDAVEPVSQGNLITMPEPVGWTAEISAGWVRMEPMSGVGSANLFFEADPNPGPRRMATVTFQSVDGTLMPIVAEIRQYQALLAEMVEIYFNLLEFVNPPIQPFMPLTGMVNTRFKPFPDDIYFSLMGKLAPDQGPAWLVRNVWMASAAHNPDPQNLSHLFNLGDLGLDPGTPVGDMLFAWTCSLDPDTMMPWVPDYAWAAFTLVPDVFDAVGRNPGGVFTMDTVTNFWPVVKLPWTVSDVVWIGCAMPNGDLDGSSSEGYDINGCGPAAAANSLNWLEGEHPEVNIPGGWREAYEQLGTLMDRDSGRTVNDGAFIRAKLDFIEMYDLPIKVKYQANTVEGDVESTSGNSEAEDQDGDEADLPEKDWMVDELEDDEDVEIGLGYPGYGHWVTATGTITINGQTYIFVKHDLDQNGPDSTKQQGSPVVEGDDGMILPGLGNGRVEIVVSESYDPDHQSVPDTETFDKYCQSFKRTIPPDASITITYPDNPDRCFNTTVRVLNRAESDSYINEATWNFNSGKSRTWHNDTGQPVTVEFHNDDHFDGGEMLKTYRWYQVVIAKIFNNQSGSSDPSNEEVYAGFSIGSDNGTAGEFGHPAGEEVVYNHFNGSMLKDFPQGLSSNAVKKVTIRYPVKKWNRYWMSLGLELGIAEVLQPASLIIDCPSTGFTDTLQIDVKGRKFVELGAAGVVPSFDISFTLEGSGAFLFDHVGIPSLVQIEPIIKAVPELLVLEAGLDGDTLFRIRNLGGTDMNWTLTETADWFSLSPMSGINEADITVNFLANAGDARQDVITIDAPGARNTPYTVVVKQDSAGSGIELIPKGTIMVDLYPNPNRGEFTLEISGLDPGRVTTRILDLTGKKVYSSTETVNGPDLKKPLNLPKLKGGIYSVVVETRSKTVVKQFVLERRP